jgi:hypothetical protein
MRIRKSALDKYTDDVNKCLSVFSSFSVISVLTAGGSENKLETPAAQKEGNKLLSKQQKN